jgi:UDP-4-amino-4,6-dideoxy-N-acetyl-beta-L-altrosamine transaminase
MIPYGRQNIDQDDIDSVVEVLKSDFLTQGPAIAAFEKEIATYCKAKHAIAVNSATAALHMAYRALGLGKGDIAWTTPNTFPATSNAALFCGASIDFVDIDPATYNLCPNALRAKLEAAKKNGTLPKIVIPVHFAGQSCDMEAISLLAKEYGFAIVEDASHCIGGDYKNNKIGSCEYSDACVFSFHPVKIMTTGEGGAVTTNRDDLNQKFHLLRSHGITRDEGLFEKTNEGGWYYEQVDLAPNYRITDIQAALGLTQLNKVDKFIARRRELASRYNTLYEDVPNIRPYQLPDSNSSWHLYVIQVPAKRRKQIYDSLKEAGIGVNVHYIPVHTHPYYETLGFKRGAFPNSETYYQSAITLPLYYDLTNEQIEYISKHVKMALAVEL